MKSKLFTMCMFAAMSVLFSSCFLIKSKKSDDPIAAIEELSKEVLKSGNDWEEKEWNEAADKLDEALKNLPSPLETAEEIQLTSSLSAISAVVNTHERRAAQLIKVIERYNNKTSKPEEGTKKSASYDLKGKIGPYPITMHLDVDGKQVKGYYFYNRGSSKLQLMGSLDGSALELNETTSEGRPTGHFEGALESEMYQGVFTTNQGKKYTFIVAEDGVDISGYTTGELEDMYETDTYTDNTDSSGGSVDVDEMLDAYDKYVTKYISYVKKASRGDASAMAEYPGLLQQAQDLSQKIERVRGNMSSSQLARYNKINTRMIEAAQQMQ